MDISRYVVVPAYGRDYKTLDEVKAAWEAGKDFQIRSIDRNDGRYMSIRDGLPVQIRFNKLADIYVWPESSPDAALDDQYLD